MREIVLMFYVMYWCLYLNSLCVYVCMRVCVCWIKCWYTLSDMHLHTCMLLIGNGRGSSVVDVWPSLFTIAIKWLAHVWSNHIMALPNDINVLQAKQNIIFKLYLNLTSLWTFTYLVIHVSKRCFMKNKC